MSRQAGTGIRTPGSRWPAPGAFLDRSRYRLLDEVGRDDRCAAQLWRGRDELLGREVALTLFLHDPARPAADTDLRAVTQRALRSARLVIPGAAQVLEVLEPTLHSGHLVAAVVAEWTPGSDLGELVRDDLPPPSLAARLLLPLAGAVDAAHHAGLVLGCDHPKRITITQNSGAWLAFPGPAPQAGPQDDIRGLGAALYLLLTGYWPLPGSAGGLPPPPIGPQGIPISPHTLRPEVPEQLSTLALSCLTGTTTAGLPTVTDVQRVLEFTTATTLDGDPATALTDPPGAAADPEQLVRTRRFRLRMSVIALLGATFLILGYTAVQLASVFESQPSGPPAVIVRSPPATPPPPTPPAR